MNQSIRGPKFAPWKHWPAERLKQEQLGNPRSFARGFEMKAYTDAELWFPSFKGCFTPGVVVGDIIRRGWPTYAGVDLAGAKRPGNVIFVVAVDDGGRRYPVEILRGGWTAPETAKQIYGVSQRHQNLRYFMVENNGYQQSLIDFIKSEPSWPGLYYKVESFTTGQRNKADVNYGLRSLEIEFSKKQWVVPESEFAGHPPACQCGWCAWRQEMANYPFAGEGDTAMACWFAREAIARLGGGRSSGSSGLGLGADFNAR